MQQGGSQYRRLIEAFQRVFGATICFGTNTQLKVAPVFHQVRFNFMSEAHIWYGRNFDQPNLPGDCQNMIVLTPEFYREVTSHPIHTDLQAAKYLSCAPPPLWTSLPGSRIAALLPRGKSGFRCLANSVW